jgi:hypothetical protein
LPQAKKRGRKRAFPSYTPKFSGHRPSSISVAGRAFITESWRDVLLRTCEVVLTRRHADFSRILELKGRKRLWFSRKAEELYAPIMIRGTDIFAECNVNANGLVLRSLQVLNLFGLKPDIRIDIKE